MKNQLIQHTSWFNRLYKELLHRNNWTRVDTLLKESAENLLSFFKKNLPQLFFEDIVERRISCRRRGYFAEETLTTHVVRNLSPSTSSIIKVVFIFIKEETSPGYKHKKANENSRLEKPILLKTRVRRVHILWIVFFTILIACNSVRYL